MTRREIQECQRACRWSTLDKATVENLVNGITDYYNRRIAKGKRCQAGFRIAGFQFGEDCASLQFAVVGLPIGAFRRGGVCEHA